MSTKALGGRAWIGLPCNDKVYAIPIVLWSNTTTGLIRQWWHGSRQQPGRAMLTITRIGLLTILVARSLSTAQIELAQRLFSFYSELDFLPVNEAYRDNVRKDLDKSVLVDLCG